MTYTPSNSSALSKYTEMVLQVIVIVGAGVKLPPLGVEPSPPSTGEDTGDGTGVDTGTGVPAIGYPACNEQG